MLAISQRYYEKLMGEAIFRQIAVKNMGRAVSMKDHAVAIEPVVVIKDGNDVSAHSKSKKRQLYPVRWVDAMCEQVDVKSRVLLGDLGYAKVQ